MKKAIESRSAVLTTRAKRVVRSIAVAVLAAPLLAACKEDKPYMLGITAYNYSERYIDRFNVNGQGGPNVGAHESAGGESCCIVLRKDQELPVKVYVEWTYGSKWDFDKGIELQPQEKHKGEAELKGPLPAKPSMLVVHFYPDHHVEVEVADDYPPFRGKRK